MDGAGIVAYFEDELGLDEVHSVAGSTGHTGRTKLGHPGVVEAAGAERSLDQVAGRGYARARLARMHGDSDVARAQIDARRLRGLGQPDGVRGRRAEHGCAQAEPGPQSR